MFGGCILTFGGCILTIGGYKSLLSGVVNAYVWGC